MLRDFETINGHILHKPPICLIQELKAFELIHHIRLTRANMDPFSNSNILVQHVNNILQNESQNPIILFFWFIDQSLDQKKWIQFLHSYVEWLT